ncbi:hypothetical protein EDD68_11197 [Melghiribacillus thermohalophilus]|uniref:Phospholipase A2-like protein n=1 Tax=Melghiribacillus thermohalophilus TaxID=1324956 RepID=A0A4R3MZT1_9BACI|nr:hypothetical protein [Melghiribacillus thermohalophilus]TCT21136.1 hypothetical protein EDD68_11197 [Melghiribacillus thermohalophilus]
MLNLSNGGIMKGTELQNLIEEMRKNPDFQKLKSEFNKLIFFDDSEYIVRLAYHFDEVVDEGKVIVGKYIILSFANNKVNIRFDKNKLNDEMKTVVSGRMVVKENGNELLKGFMVKNGQLRQYLEKPYENELEKPLVIDRANDPSYTPGEIENSINAQGWTVCLYDYPEFYNHCGPGCGDGLRYGGGEPINGLDECCRGHDRCYATFGYGDCECDNVLLDCAAQYEDDYPTNVGIIRTVFDYC